MKNGPLFFIGLFAALLISWAGLVLGSHAQIGSLAPYYDDGEGSSFPSRTSGIAARGAQVYADLGCAACHTQQVRRPDFGSDQARKWGDRQSVARDYIFQARPQLGAQRIGPDLANLGARNPDVEELTNLLYAGKPMDPQSKGAHPTYKFLFETRELGAEAQPSAYAAKVSGAAAGAQIVPSERARILIAYLQSLNNAYAYPESRPLPPPAAGGHGAAPAPAPAAPQALKKEEGKK